MEDSTELAEQLFADALYLPPARRDAFLDSACSGTPALRAEVDALLEAHRRMGSFLEAPVLGGRFETMAAPETLRPGTALGRYVLQMRLGSGGMGSVYQAVDARLERTVAVKVLSPDLLRSAEAGRRFRKEATALARLSHASIAAVYDVGEQAGVDYIVMECVPGVPLSARLHEGTLPIETAVAILREVAQALEAAHEQGVVHRDLKPANVMITPRGHAKVLDFGIAKLLTASGSQEGRQQTLTEGGVPIGTPVYMSPEQVQARPVDARSDIWSFGILAYEILTGQVPFDRPDVLTLLREICERAAAPVSRLRPDVPPQLERIVARCLEKQPEKRYAGAAALIADLDEVQAGISGERVQQDVVVRSAMVRSSVRWVSVTLAVVACLGLAIGGWLYHRSSQARWAREEAPDAVAKLQADRKPVAAWLLLKRALAVLPADAKLLGLEHDMTAKVSVTSAPAGALVQIQDYLSPEESWYTLGTTPLTDAVIPKGYLRWKLSRAGEDDLVSAPSASPVEHFDMTGRQNAPEGMVEVPAPARPWFNSVGFIGWLGPYKIPSYFVDRYEVTNAAYQRFVDSGGYTKPEYWTKPFTRDGTTIGWAEAINGFRDSTGRPGPSTWEAGHYPQGQGNLPVTGVSWFEAMAYAAFVGKDLPTAAQWFQIAPPDLYGFVVQESNIGGQKMMPVGSTQGVGPLGTYDTAGNAREWTANTVAGDLRFILGGSWKSPAYLYANPEALSPFDRSDTNGFRCVKNVSPLPEGMLKPIVRAERDFTKFHTVSNDVFHAYSLVYAYANTPLEATSDGVVRETVDWIEEKVSYNTAYDSQRMSAYLFLPKHVAPPYQTVLFFPSARVSLMPLGGDNYVLGDTKFFDYIVGSGRAVIYPVYEGTYNRRAHEVFPLASQYMGLTTRQYKDAARSLDYLATRKDIDSTRLAYLGVSMGAAEGAIFTSLLQDRLRTAIFLDGGFFLDTPPLGGDAADFAVRMKKPVLMVNGRYDYTFPVVKAQDPLFNLLGTSPAQKRHIVLDTPHDVTEQRPQLVHAVLDWLDEYLGRVGS